MHRLSAPAAAGSQELKRLYQQTCDDLAAEVESAAAARAAALEAGRKSMTDQASAATAWSENNALKASTAAAIEVRAWLWAPRLSIQALKEGAQPGSSHCQEPQKSRTHFIR